MGDTFLWMPRPRTIVVKDGKPVIDCNPKLGKVKMSFSITDHAYYHCDTECSLADPHAAAHEQYADIDLWSGRGGDEKVLSISGGATLEYYASGDIHTRTETGTQDGCSFDVNSYADVEVAILPCMPEAGFDFSMWTHSGDADLRCEYSPEEPGGDPVIVIDSDTPYEEHEASIEITNESDFAVEITYECYGPNTSISPTITTLQSGQSITVLNVSYQAATAPGYRGGVYVRCPI